MIDKKDKNIDKDFRLNKAIELLRKLEFICGENGWECPICCLSDKKHSKNCELDKFLNK